MHIVTKLSCKLDFLNSAVEKITINVAWIFLAAITFLNILQVYYRYILDDALNWTEELSLGMLVWMVFFIMPMAYRKGCNVSMELFRRMLKRNRAEFVIRCLIHVLVFIMSCICIQLSYDMYRRGYGLELPALQVPYAYIYMALPACFVLLNLAILEVFLKDLRGVFDPAKAAEEERLLDAAEHAREEQAARELYEAMEQEVHNAKTREREI